MLKNFKHLLPRLAWSFILVSTFIAVYSVLRARAYDWAYFDSLALVIKSSILHYQTFPMHDPWACSGTSLLSNPQSWVFSPLIIFSLLFSPTMGNLLSVIFLKVLGFWGCLKYFSFLKIEKNVSYLCSALFINLSWFSLHLAEGHIAFRTFYLLPLTFLFIEDLSNRKTILKLGSVFSFMILDGGFYPLIFSLTYFLLYYIFTWDKLKDLFYFLKSNLLFTLTAIAGCALLVAPKLYPVILNSGGMKLTQEFYSVSFDQLLDIFYNPFLNNTHSITNGTRFHEFGCYLGLGLTLLFIVSLKWCRSWSKHQVLRFIIGIIFLWIGLGALEVINPYRILSAIPLLNKAHIQSRYLIVFGLLFISFLGVVSKHLQSRKLVISLLLLANLEFIMTNHFSFPLIGSNDSLPMIERTSWNKTEKYIPKPNLYYSPDTNSKFCYEPSAINSSSRSIEDEGYFGEIAVMSGSAKTGALTLTPGHISFDYESPSGADIILNTHYLDGWTEINNNGSTYEFHKLLAIKLPQGRGRVELEYFPGYYNWTIISSLIGLLLLTFLAKRKKEFDYSKIPVGYYDHVLLGKNGMRKFWHYHKFESVLRYIPDSMKGSDKRILDLGCFAGSFLGMVPQGMFGYQLGLDILPEQIDYAENKYGTDFRAFRYYDYGPNLDDSLKDSFDVITLIEVIEHLSNEQLQNLFLVITKLLKPGGCLIITTPNYISTWPVLELMVDLISDVKYEEQHLTKLNYFNLDSKVSDLSDSKLAFDAKTTTHFLSPFIATFSYETAKKMAVKVPSAEWKNPFGNIILSRWYKR